VIDLRAAPANLPMRARPAPTQDVAATVRSIIESVRERGDDALIELTKRFDRADLSAGGLRATASEFERARGAAAPEVRRAIDEMIERLRDLHRRQLPGEWWDRRDGVRFGEIVRPVRRAGCYVPGGRAAYPSTVAMTVVPAAVAGVERIVVATPPRADGSSPAEVLYAAEQAGAHEVLKVGGAQAIAALAYGTPWVEAVDVIVGPGSRYVTEAKRQVFGAVGIEGLAGPTELVVVADHTALPAWLVTDLAAQAEHDPDATGTLVTWIESLAVDVARALQDDPVTSSRSRIVLVRDREHAAVVANQFAPEHLEVVVADPGSFLPLVRTAGAVFLGPWSTVPFGDYGVGSNHVLPTMATARFASGLRATHFLKVTAVVDVLSEGAAAFAPGIASLARSEGLPAHARAVEARTAGVGVET